MQPLWTGDGVLEYVSLDGFNIRVERTGNVVTVTCDRGDEPSSVTLDLGPNYAPGHRIRIEELEVCAISGYKAGKNMEAIAQGLPRPFTFPGDLSQKRRKKGKE